MKRTEIISQIMHTGLDLSRVHLIRESSAESLIDQSHIEELMLRLGMNVEKPDEQPEIVNQNGGGLYIWQYPNQFSNYLLQLNKYKIESFMEIGCRWGGTFILTTEFLKKTNHLKKSLAIDIIDSPVRKYCALDSHSDFVMSNSSSSEFKEMMNGKQFDMIFIDGDHSYLGVSTDFYTCKQMSEIFVFHDIASDACPGVVQFWKELKEKEHERFHFYEFTQQYDDVFQKTGKKYLGIGMAVSKHIDIR
jgi:hypothetical protein